MKRWEGPGDGRELLQSTQAALPLKHTRDTTVSRLRQVNDYFAKFVPETVKRLIASNPEAPHLSLHDCDVSVLFLDISEYSRLSQQMPPRVLTTLVEQYFSRFLDCIYAADGDINEIAGDGFMAIFQGVDPCEHVIRAVNTAFALLCATQALNRANHGQTLAVHMGINSGLALLGLHRLEGRYGTRWTFTARGPMTNLAARLADLAAPGQILAGSETVRRLGSRYVIHNLGSEQLKNLVEPVAVYCLLGVTE